MIKRTKHVKKMICTFFKVWFVLFGIEFGDETRERIRTFWKIERYILYIERERSQVKGTH